MITYTEAIHSIILIATVFAIIYGPIKAVKITRKLDAEKEARERKFSIFRCLMQTRQIRIDPQHVGALNLIELEFYGYDNIIKAHREYVKHLGAPLPKPDDQESFFEERHDYFLTLLQVIANELGYKFDKRELDRLAYTPEGWVNDQELQRKNAFLLSQLLSGERPIAVAQYIATQHSKFPPPPITSD